MENSFNHVSPFRQKALERKYRVDLFAHHTYDLVVSYTGLSVFDVQEFLILVDDNCYIKITCDS